MQQEFLSILSEIRDQGRTIFLSSHALDEVERVADRIGLIRQGKLSQIGTVDELRADARQPIEIRFDQPVSKKNFVNLAGVSNLEIEGTVLRCVTVGSLDALIKAAARHTVIDIKIAPQDLEQIFLDLYRKEL